MKQLIIIYIAIIAINFPNILCAQKMKIKIDSREVVLNYPDSTIKANISLKEKKYKPKTNQVYYWYKSNEIKKNLGGYSGRLLNGKYTCYDLDKNMIAEGHFENGVKTGVWKRWFPKGGLEKIETFKKGKKEGEFIFYNPNGQLRSIISYKKGILNGKYTEYNNDTVLFERNFKKGVEIVPNKKDEITEEKEKEKQQQKEKKPKEDTPITKKPDEKEKIKLTKEEKQDIKLKKQEEKAAEKARKQAEKEQKRLEKEQTKKEDV